MNGWLVPEYTYFVLLVRAFRPGKAVSEPGPSSSLAGGGSRGSLAGGSDPGERNGRAVGCEEA